MPYIKKENREKWNDAVKEVQSIIESVSEDKKEGELNYFFTSVLKKIYKPSYFNYNRIIGLLECIKQEFYRRDVSSYEDEKIKENGDVSN